MTLLSCDSSAELLDIDINSLHKEIYPTTQLDKKVIENWLTTYKKTGHSFDHPLIQTARVYQCSGMHNEAIYFLKRFLNVKCDHAVYSWYLQTHYHSDISTNASLLAEHLQYAAIFPKHYNKNWRNQFDKTPKKKLKIAYLCHFFVNSVSITSFIPFLKLHDPNKFEVYCYDDGNTPPEYKQYATKWTDIRDLSDEALTKLIKADGIDILQEMNGFCAINRFRALAYRPAPIQINWFNHAGTTGLPYIDYVMSDKVTIIDADLPFYVERVYRTPEFIAAKEFEKDRFSDISAHSPCFQKGYITFAFFGGSHKCSTGTIALWAKVLQAIPNSILLLKNTALHESVFHTTFMAQFNKHGIDSGRVKLEPGSDQVNLLKRYNDVDIVLDSVPVSGGSTVFEALMQSIPCVSLMGNRWGSRQGASVLLTARHPELVAYSEAEYISIAKSIAENPARLNDYRQHLREDMLHSSLTNIGVFYQNFEQAYQTMWQEWVNQGER